MGGGGGFRDCVQFGFSFIYLKIRILEHDWYYFFKILMRFFVCCYINNVICIFGSDYAIT